ncbi:MAG: cyclase [Thermomicrobiales bacterium]|nr:cyclase [Thermomicrobiales bacterium]
MALLAVQHAVRDYPAWRAIYDSLDELQCDWGVLSASVHQLDSAPNTVLVLRQFATVAQAQGFLTNRQVRAAMERAGVEDEPRIEIYA